VNQAAERDDDVECQKHILIIAEKHNRDFDQRKGVSVASAEGSRGWPKFSVLARQFVKGPLGAAWYNKH
jgi:hypothetical protein